MIKDIKLTDPRGKKSSPVMASRSEDFPEDWDPRTQIEGSLMICCSPMSLSPSIRLISFLRFSKSNALSIINKLKFIVVGLS